MQNILRRAILLVLALVLTMFSIMPISAYSDVERWHPYDLPFTTTNSYTNPFQNVTMSATFTGPGSTTLVIPGFYTGSNTWKIRFAPTLTGTWNFTTSSNDSQLNNKTGTINCIANTNPKVHGRLHVDTGNPHHFIFEDGAHHLLMGYETDWLGLMDFGDVNITKAKQLIDLFSSHGFTEAILNVYAHDTSWCSGDTGADDFGPPTSYAWLGTNSSPDHSKMNTVFFETYDRVIDYLFQKGVTAHIFFKVYNKAVNWPAKLSANEDMYFKYVTARYQAYPNIVWDFSKESYNESDHNYIKNRLTLVKDTDAYDRLLTTHDDDNYCSDANYNSSIDFYTDQNHGSWYSTIINQRNARNWPVYNSEYGYEIGNDGGKTYGVVQSKEEVLQRTCEVFMAGGYPCYYYTYHAWDVVRTYEHPNGLDYYLNLSNFLKSTNWYRLSPNDSLIGGGAYGKHCLANTGREYIVYLNAGGSVTLSISGATASLTAQWVNIYTGAQQSAGSFGNGSHNFTSPWSTPAMLYLVDSGSALSPTPTPTPAGTPVPGSGDGLTGKYYDNMDFTTLKVTRVDGTVNFSWGSGSPDASIGGDTFSVRWTGKVKAPYSDTYTFYVNSNDGNRLWVNGVQLTNRWTDGISEESGVITLSAGQQYDITLEMYENINTASCAFSWSCGSISKQVIPQQYLYSGATGPTATPTPTPTPTPAATATPTPVPGGEIVLYGSDFTVYGTSHWSKLSDSNAVGGYALKSSNVYASVQASPSDYVQATFTANAGTTYYVWARGKGDIYQEWYSDAFWVQFDKSTDTAGTAVYRIGTTDGYQYNGYAYFTAYNWLGGDAQNTNIDVAPLTIKFTTTGTQTIRIQSRQQPMRIDEVWVSPTQSTRPNPQTMAKYK